MSSMNGTFHPMQPIQEVGSPLQSSTTNTTTTGPEEDSLLGSDILDDEEEDIPVNESLLDVPSFRPNEKTRFVTIYVIVASLLAALGGVLFGYDVGIVSGALLQLTRDFNLSCLQQELVVSSMLFGALLASLTGGFLVDHIGRRVTIIGNSVVFIAGAVLLTFAPNYPTLVVGRLVVGFGVSLSAIAECVYITEIAPPNQRGLLVSLNELGITVGFLIAYLINLAFLQTPSGWRYMFGISIIPALLQGVGMAFLPSSPRFLMIQRQEEEARKTLVRLRGTEDVDNEINSIRDSVGSQRAGGILDICRKRENMCFRFMLGLGLVFFQQCTGQPSVLYYAPTIFLSVGFGSDSSAMIATVGLGIVKVVFTTVALLSVDCAGRRKFLLTGTFMMLAGIACLGFTALSQNTGVTSNNCQLAKLGDNSLVNMSMSGLVFSNGQSSATQERVRIRRDHSLMFPIHISATGNNTAAAARAAGGSPLVKWLSFAALVLYTAGYAVGFGPVSWLVLSEIFPSQMRGRAISLATVANWGTNLMVSFTFLDLMSAISLSGTFLLYAGIGAIALLYIFFLVPETKGKTLEEISSHLNQSYIAASFPCCQPQPISRLHLSEDCDLDDMEYSGGGEAAYSLLSTE